MPTVALPGPQERSQLQQSILNAQAIPPRDSQRLDRQQIDVTVHPVWERDGARDLETVARDWADQAVLVDISDDRWPHRGVWLHASDVTRR